jgi:hypothetical protein
MEEMVAGSNFGGVVSRQQKPSRLNTPSHWGYQSECGNRCLHEKHWFCFDYSDLAGTQIGGLLFGREKWVRSLSSSENTCSRVVSRNLNL